MIHTNWLNALRGVFGMSRTKGKRRRPFDNGFTSVETLEFRQLFCASPVAAEVSTLLPPSTSPAIQTAMGPLAYSELPLGTANNLPNGSMPRIAAALAGSRVASTSPHPLSTGYALSRVATTSPRPIFTGLTLSPLATHPIATGPTLSPLATHPIATGPTLSPLATHPIATGPTLSPLATIEFAPSHVVTTLSSAMASSSINLANGRIVRNTSTESGLSRVATNLSSEMASTVNHSANGRMVRSPPTTAMLETHNSVSDRTPATPTNTPNTGTSTAVAGRLPRIPTSSTSGGALNGLGLSRTQTGSSTNPASASLTGGSLSQIGFKVAKAQGLLTPEQITRYETFFKAQLDAVREMAGSPRERDYLANG